MSSEHTSASSDEDVNFGGHYSILGVGCRLPVRFNVLNVEVWTYKQVIVSELITKWLSRCLDYLANQKIPNSAKTTMLYKQVSISAIRE